MRYRVKVEWENEDGSVEAAELGQVQTAACLSAADVGLKLLAAKELVARLQEIVITRQLHRHCEAARPCPKCNAPRRIRDYRTRTLDTVLGRVVVNAPRFEGCHVCGQRGLSPHS